MVFTWKRFILLLLILGVSLTVFGIILNPIFVAKYVKGAAELSSNSTKRVINYQLYAVMFGYIIIFTYLLFLPGKYGKYLIIPISIFYFFIIHNIYIDKKYPNNLFINPAGLKKTWNVLLGNELVLS